MKKRINVFVPIEKYRDKMRDIELMYAIRGLKVYAFPPDGGVNKVDYEMQCRMEDGCTLEEACDFTLYSGKKPATRGYNIETEFSQSVAYAKELLEENV